MLSLRCPAGFSPVASPSGRVGASHRGASLVAEHRLAGTWALAGAARGSGLWPLDSGARLRSCSGWARLLLGIWTLPGPGVELVSPAPAGGFFATEPPGRPQDRL